MACLGLARAELSLLQAATGEPADVVDQALAPALEEGLLVAEPGHIRADGFGTTGIREAVLGRLDTERGGPAAAMARRLAADPELFAVAVEQYLPVRRGWRRRRATPGGGAAAARRRQGHADRGLRAGERAADRRASGGRPGETATLAAVHTGRHAALYCLGRLEEADEEYRTIEQLCPGVVDRADATAVQVHSVTHRTRLLRRCGSAWSRCGTRHHRPGRGPARRRT